MISHSAPWITDGDRAAVQDVMLTGQIAAGERVRQFERAIADYDGTAGAVAVASGTAALTIALRALGIGQRDEVILPTYVCSAVAKAVRATGASPVLCDVGDEWVMTAETVARRISPATRAIVLVHLFGISVAREPFRDFGVPVVDDLCQAFGAPGLSQSRGLSFYSFHATKCLTTGEGGAVSAGDPELLERVRVVAAKDPTAARLSDVQAALGLSQLARYDQFLAIRREQSADYFESIPSRLTRQLASVRNRSMFFRFPLRMDSARGGFDDAREFFAATGIAVRRGVDTLLHREAGLSDTEFPGAMRCYSETISVPLRPGLPPDARERIVTRVAEYVGR